MISNLQYMTLTRAMKKTSSIKDASEIANMHRNTASKYIRGGLLPSEMKKKRLVHNKADVIQLKHWEEVVTLLKVSPELEATAIFDHLLEKYPSVYKGTELRTLQRKIRKWRVLEGVNKEVMFYQVYVAGERSQSDFIHMNYLGITIGGKKYDHIVFHFVLCYSGWEDVLICEGGESFDNLSSGFERALWRLGGIPEIHRTDNLSAARTVTEAGSYFTTNWKHLTDHYAITPTVNNPGKSNENGKVERSNGLFKVSLENQLALRGSKDFASIKEYQTFIDKIVEKRNLQRKAKIMEERPLLRDLPESKWNSCFKLPVKVHSDSTVHIEGATYSVNSRTIGSTLSAYVYPDKIELMLGNTHVSSMIRLKKGEVSIDFKHIIHSLKHKPGAFENYKYKEYMYPTLSFRKAYDKLRVLYAPISANKHYIQILDLAKMYSVEDVSSALEATFKARSAPIGTNLAKYLIKAIDIPETTVLAINLSEYDKLLIGS